MVDKQLSRHDEGMTHVVQTTSSGEKYVFAEGKIPGIHLLRARSGMKLLYSNNKKEKGFEYDGI